MLPENESAWERLGRLLADRRTEIGARYRNKNLFAEERDINRRMVWSVETGARDNYGKDTLRAVESAYALVPGSIARTVAGGPLEPLPRLRDEGTETAPPAPRVLNDPKDDAAAVLFLGDSNHARLLRSIWRYSEDEKKRDELLEVADPKLAAALRGLRGQSEAGLARTLQSHVQGHD